MTTLFAETQLSATQEPLTYLTRWTKSLGNALLGLSHSEDKQQERSGCKHCTPEKAQAKVEKIIRASVDVASLLHDPKRLEADLLTFYLESAVRAREISWELYTENGIGGYTEGMAQNAQNFWQMMETAAQAGQTIDGKPIDARRAYYEWQVVEKIQAVIQDPQAHGFGPGDYLVYVSPAGYKEQGYFGRDTEKPEVFHLTYVFQIKADGQTQYWQVASKLPDKKLEQSVLALKSLADQQLTLELEPNMLSGKMQYMEKLAPLLKIDRSHSNLLTEVRKLFAKDNDLVQKHYDLVLNQTRHVVEIISQLYQELILDQGINQVIGKDIDPEVALLKLISLGYEYLGVWTEKLRSGQIETQLINPDLVRQVFLSRIKTLAGVQTSPEEKQAIKTFVPELTSMVGRFSSVTQCVVLSPASVTRQLDMVSNLSASQLNILSTLDIGHKLNLSAKEINLVQELTQKGYVLVDFTDQGATQIFMVPAEYLKGKGVRFVAGKVLGPCDIPLDDPREKLAVLIKTVESSNAYSWFKEKTQLVVASAGESDREKLLKLFRRIAKAVFEKSIGPSQAIVNDTIKNHPKARAVYERLRTMLGEVGPNQLLSKELANKILNDAKLRKWLKELEVILNLEPSAGESDFTPHQEQNMVIQQPAGVIYASSGF